MITPKAPTGAGAAGRRLWRSVVSDFDLDAPEEAILREVVRVCDRLEQLDQAIRRDGAVLESGKPNPCVTEARQQQIVLSRLVASLRLPDDSGDRPQRRGSARGVYGVRS